MFVLSRTSPPIRLAERFSSTSPTRFRLPWKMTPGEIVPIDEESVALLRIRGEELRPDEVIRRQLGAGEGPVQDW